MAKIKGTNFNDILSGTSQADTMFGLGGNDTLNGGAGNDRLFGGAGNDKLFGGAGDDTLNGGNGKDTLNGAAGVDTMLGGAGKDVLNGGAGDDMLFGGAGNDRLVGGAGSDLLDGGAGADVFVVATEQGFPSDAVTYENSPAGVNVAIGGSLLSTFASTFVVPGTAHGGDAEGDVLSGNAGLIGSSFADGLGGNEEINILYGNAGNDLLLGFANQDQLIGGSGDDFIVGGLGADILAGDFFNSTPGGGVTSVAGGHDVFEYDSVLESGVGIANRDEISDFEHGIDKIDLSHIDADVLQNGDQAFNLFGPLPKGTPTLGADVSFYQENGNTILHGQQVGGGGQFEIELIGLVTLTRADFIL